MDKSNPFVACAFDGLFVNQACSFISSLFKLGLDVIDPICDVMDSFTLTFEEFGDRTVFGCRLEEFNMGFSSDEEGRFYLLRGNFLNVFAFKPECFLVKWYAFFQGLYRYPEVIHFLYHGECSFLTISYSNLQVMRKINY